ncbi:MAG TPA: TlpA disulfide reductase family protein [Sphingobacterium sp.]|nr:TlpA disulfide reductase family protein [Sphingobacterium sp.]
MKNIIFYFFTFFLCCQTNFLNGQVQLTIESSYFDPRDTLELRLWDDYIGYPYKNEYILLKAVATDGGLYRFEFDIQKDHWMTLHFDYQRYKGSPHNAIMENYLLTKGDSLYIRLYPVETSLQKTYSFYENGLPVIRRAWKAEVSGRGHEKFVEKQEWDILLARYKEIGVADMVFAKSILETEFPVRSDQSKLLEYNAKGALLDYVTFDIQRRLRSRSLPNSDRDSLSNQYQYYFSFDESLYDEEQLDAMSSSPEYVEYVYHHFVLSHHMQYGNYNVRSMFDMIKNGVGHERLRERVLTRFLMTYFSKEPDPEMLEITKTMITDPLCKLWLEHIGGGAKGKLVKFSMPDITGKYHSIEDYSGKILLIDFWYMSCIPCRNYMQQVLKPLSEYFSEDERFQIITVSTDERHVLEKLLKNNGFLPRNGLHLYTDNKRFRHPLLVDLGVQSYPHPILVSAEGKIIGLGAELKNMENLIQLIQVELGKIK